jgi:hypothetical protein
MNRIYRLVWNHALGALQVVSELACSKARVHVLRAAIPWLGYQRVCWLPAW